MGSKLKNAKKKSKELIDKYTEIEANIKIALEDEKVAMQEDADKLKEVREKIEELCKAEGLFCGVILHREHLHQIIDLAIDSNDKIELPFNLYFKD